MKEMGNVVGRPSLRSGPAFGVLCRLTAQKGIRYILEALKAYRDKRGGVDFTFAGWGDLEEMIEEFVREHELADVRIVRVDNARKILENIDVFVHPSIGDAMPMSIAEALMCSCPCIVCSVGGVPDLVRNGVEGFVIEPGDSDGILERMIRFADMEQDELEEFRRRARARWEEMCRPEAVGKIVASHYWEIIGHPGKSEETS